MGFLKPSAPQVQVVQPDPAPTVDDGAVQRVNDTEAKRRRMMRGYSSTVLRRNGVTGGAAAALAKTVGRTE